MEITQQQETFKPRSFFARFSTSIIALTTLAIFALGLWIPSPFLIERPGPTLDTLGDIEVGGVATPVVQIEGAEVFESSGELRLLTVSIVGNPENPLGWLSLLPTLFDKTQSVVPMSALFGDGSTKEDREEMNAIMMQDSQTNAVAASLRALGMEFESTVTISSVVQGAPSENIMREGDVLLRMDGQEVDSVSSLRREIAAIKVGEEIVFEVLRDGKQEEVRVHTVAGANPSQSVIGVLLKTDYVFPVEVVMAVEGIGGPSAGLMFALAIYNSLTQEDLVEGVVVAGTGTVDDRGNVGGIGGIQQKVWGAERSGAELFLFPVSNCVDMPISLPKDLAFAPVATVDEAIEAITSFRSGAKIAGAERCSELLARSRG